MIIQWINPAKKPRPSGRGDSQESLASNSDIIYFIENKQTISKTLNIKNKYDLLSEKIKEFNIFMEEQSIYFDKKTNQNEKWWRSDNKECFLDINGNINYLGYVQR